MIVPKAGVAWVCVDGVSVTIAIAVGDNGFILVVDAVAIVIVPKAGVAWVCVDGVGVTVAIAVGVSVLRRSDGGIGQRVCEIGADFFKVGETVAIGIDMKRVGADVGFLTIG